MSGQNNGSTYCFTLRVYEWYHRVSLQFILVSQFGNYVNPKQFYSVCLLHINSNILMSLVQWKTEIGTGRKSLKLNK